MSFSAEVAFLSRQWKLDASVVVSVGWLRRWLELGMFGVEVTSISEGGDPVWEGWKVSSPWSRHRLRYLFPTVIFYY